MLDHMLPRPLLLSTRLVTTVVGGEATAIASRVDAFSRQSATMQQVGSHQSSSLIRKLHEF